MPSICTTTGGHMAALKYSSIKNGSTITIKIGGSLDAKTAPQLDKKLSDEREKNPDTIIISMADIDYIASAGMGTLVNCNELMNNNGKKLKLCDLSPKVLKIVKMLGFTNFFNIYPTLEEAENG